MATKLDIGDVFPAMTLNLVGGGTATLPDLADAKYQLILFYRGHW
jgi:peroxiredoxin